MRTVRVGTILWGAILLVFAAIAFSVAVFDLQLLQAVSVTWVVTGLGGVFVLAAIVALIARAVSSDRVSTGSTTVEPEAKDQPVD